MGRPSSPTPAGSEIAGWPVTLKSAVKGVNWPERAKSAIGSSPWPSHSPIFSGRSASAGVSSTSYSAKNATTPRASACSCATQARYSTADIPRARSEIARDSGSISSSSGGRPASSSP